MGKIFIGVDLASGKDHGVLTKGIYKENFLTLLEQHVLLVSPEDCKRHDFLVSDEEHEYCIHCGEKRKSNRDGHYTDHPA